MPKTTQRLGITYPDTNDNPWYTSFQAFVRGVDQHLFSGVEDRNLFLIGGGAITWDSGTGTLTWDSSFSIWTPTTGALQTLDAGTVTIVNGQVWYITLTRGATGSVTLTSTVANGVPVNQGALAMGYAYDDRLYLRTGQVLTDGETVSLDTQTQRRTQQDEFTLDNTTWDFTLSYAPHELSIARVYMNGILMQSGYSLSDTALTIDEYDVSIDVDGWVVTVVYEV